MDVFTDESRDGYAKSFDVTRCRAIGRAEVKSGRDVCF